jgi:uncharacterized coiled-coil protein SlyX
VNNKPVGLLLDSVSNNIGDQAIGLVMRRFLERKAIPYQRVDPFSFHAEDYSSLIIGGGELIRPSGDPFYDRFRVPGPNILNVMGVYQPDQVEYLNDYRLVTVRSEGDKKALSPVVANVKVRPCVTLAMGEYLEGAENPLVAETILPGETIGLHFNLAIAHLIPSLLPAIQSLSRQYKLVLFPFTLYQQDDRILDAIRKWVPDVPVSPLRDPADVYRAIGRMRALVCVSLHGTIFAYAQNVPVLAFPTVPKISYFLEERGLGQYLFSAVDEMLAKLETMLAAPPDFSSAAAQDKLTVQEHLEEVARIIGETRATSSAPRASSSLAALERGAGETSKAYHGLTMKYLKLWGEGTAETLEHQHTNGRNQAQILSLQKLSGALEAQLNEKGQTIQRLSDQTAEKEQRIQELSDQTAEKELRIQELSDQTAEKELRIQELSAQLVDIKGSTAWTLIRLLWRVRLILAPHGSQRERIGQRILRSFLPRRA